MKKFKLLLPVLALTMALSSGAYAVASTRVFMICTGEQQGVFNALGGAIVSVLKKDFPGEMLKITNTSGARANCKLVGEEIMDLGLAHGETLAFTAAGDSRGGSTKPLPEIRAVAALYSNYLHVLVGKDSGIKTVADLKGKKISLGPAGSGTAVTAGVLLDALGFKRLDLSRVVNLRLADYPQKFRQKDLDAGVVVQGLPSSHAAKAMAAGAVLLPITPEVYQEMANINKSYGYHPIPKGTYQGQDQETPTVAVPTVLITNTKMDKEVIYKITREIFAHKDQLAAAHPAGREISLERAVLNLPVPLHPGAEQYYREKGVLK